MFFFCFVYFTPKVTQTPSSRLRNGGSILDGAVVAHHGRLHCQNGHARRGRAFAVRRDGGVGVCAGGGVGGSLGAAGGGADQGVPGVTCGSGDGSGKGNGHEAQALALKVLHGGTHVFLHQLRYLVLRHGQAVI